MKTFILVCLASFAPYSISMAVCPDNILGTNTGLTRNQFCAAFESLPVSGYASYSITIPKPMTATDSALRQVAEDLFGSHDLRDPEDSSRLLPPSLGGPAGRALGPAYENILMTKATALAVAAEPYILGLRVTFLPGTVVVPGWDCPDKLTNGRKDLNSPRYRSDSAACALFKSLGDSAFSRYSILLPYPPTPIDTWTDSANMARVKAIAEEMFGTYDIRDPRDSARMSVPFAGIQTDWSIGYGYYHILMRKATAVALMGEPYIANLVFDPVLPEVSLTRPPRAPGRAVLPFGYDVLGKIRKDPGRVPLRIFGTSTPE